MANSSQCHYIWYWEYIAAKNIEIPMFFLYFLVKKKMFFLLHFHYFCAIIDGVKASVVRRFCSIRKKYIFCLTFTLPVP